MSDPYAGRFLNYAAGGNSYELPLGFSGAPRTQIWAWQPSSLSLQTLILEADGSLRTSATLSGSAGNAAAGTVGAAPPSSADFQGWDDSGVLRGTSVAKPLPVQIISGGGGGTQYADGVTNATPTGTVALAKNPSNVLHALSIDGAGNLSIVIPGSVAVTGTFWQATQPVSIAAAVAVTGTFFQATQPVSAVALPLPAGAATSALQSSIISTLGSPLQAGGNVAVTNFPATQPVSGTVAVSNFPATQPVSIAATLNVAPDGTLWTKTGTSANVNVTNASLAVTGTFFQATQPVSIAATVNIAGSVSVSNFPATQPVSIAATLLMAPDGTLWTKTGTSANVNITNASVAVTGTLPVTQADGTNVVQGATTDQANYGQGAGANTMIATLKAITDTNYQLLQMMGKLVSINLAMLEQLNRNGAQLGAAPTFELGKPTTHTLQ